MLSFVLLYIIIILFINICIPLRTFFRGAPMETALLVAGYWRLLELSLVTTQTLRSVWEEFNIFCCIYFFFHLCRVLAILLS